jgi:hypothetical protein
MEEERKGEEESRGEKRVCSVALADGEWRTGGRKADELQYVNAEKGRV